jgi:hypothetical protein
MDEREPPPRRDQVPPVPLPAPPAGSVAATPTATTTERRSRPWLIVAGVVVAIGVIVVLVVLAAGGDEPFPLPDDIGGAARIEEGPFEGFVDSILEYVTGGVDGAPYAAGAAYGEALDPMHILIVVENPGFPPGATMEQFKAGYDSPGDEIQLDGLIEETRDGVRYECAPTSDVTIPTTVCTWQTDRTVGFLISFLSDRPEESMPLVQDARSDVEA